MMKREIYYIDVSQMTYDEAVDKVRFIEWLYRFFTPHFKSYQKLRLQ